MYVSYHNRKKIGSAFNYLLIIKCWQRLESWLSGLEPWLSVQKITVLFQRPLWWHLTIYDSNSRGSDAALELHKLQAHKMSTYLHSGKRFIYVL